MPVSWVRDEKIWDKAKKAAKDPENYDLIAYIYGQMGGRVKKKKGEATPMDYLNHKPGATSKREAVPSSSMAQLVRGVKRAESEWTQRHKTFRSLAEAKVDGNEVRVIIITEGPGNRRDRNYYTEEAIRDAVKKFNGVRAFIDHPTRDERDARPEGSVHGECGFYKDTELVRVRDDRTGKEVYGCEATLVCDDSPAGRAAKAKAETSILYRQAFPENGECYAGISINSDAVPQGTVEVDGEDWNRIVSFYQPRSADIVTRPARGGEFLRLLESEAFENITQKEEDKMTKIAVREALSEIAELREKARNESEVTAKRTLESLADDREAELLKALSKSKKAKEADDNGDDDDDDKDKGGDVHVHIKGKGKDDEDEEENEDEDEQGDEQDEQDEDDEQDDGEAEDETGMRKEMMKLMPKHEGEKDEAYAARLDSMSDIVRSKQGKGKESQSVEDFKKGSPKLYSRMYAHVKESLGAQARDFKALKAENTRLRLDAQIAKDLSEAQAMLDKAGIPSKYLRASMLVGKDAEAMEAEVNQVKAIMEGESRSTRPFGLQQRTAGRESTGDLRSSLESSGIPTNTK